MCLCPGRYMKYLYPYECEKRGLSSPGELQAAIDSNRREGRRQSYGSAIFSYSPVGTPTLLSSPKMQMSHLPMPHHNSGHISQVSVIKKGKLRPYNIQYMTQDPTLFYWTDRSRLIFPFLTFIWSFTLYERIRPAMIRSESDIYIKTWANTSKPMAKCHWREVRKYVVFSKHCWLKFESLFYLFRQTEI